MQIGHWSLERAVDRIGSAKRKRESPDEDEVAEILETVELTRKVVGQVSYTVLFSLYLTTLPRMQARHLDAPGSASVPSHRKGAAQPRSCQVSTCHRSVVHHAISMPFSLVHHCSLPSPACHVRVVC